MLFHAKRVPARAVILRKLGMVVKLGLFILSLIPTERIAISGCVPSVLCGVRPHQ